MTYKYRVYTLYGPGNIMSEFASAKTLKTAREVAAVHANVCPDLEHHDIRIETSGGQLVECAGPLGGSSTGPAAATEAQ